MPTSEELRLQERILTLERRLLTLESQGRADLINRKLKICEIDRPDIFGTLALFADKQDTVPTTIRKYTGINKIGVDGDFECLNGIFGATSVTIGSLKMTQLGQALKIEDEAPFLLLKDNVNDITENTHYGGLVFTDKDDDVVFDIIKDADNSTDVIIRLRSTGDMHLVTDVGGIYANAVQIGTPSTVRESMGMWGRERLDSFVWSTTDLYPQNILTGITTYYMYFYPTIKASCTKIEVEIYGSYNGNTGGVNSDMHCYAILRHGSDASGWSTVTSDFTTYEDGESGIRTLTLNVTPAETLGKRYMLMIQKSQSDPSTIIQAILRIYGIHITQ